MTSLQDVPGPDALVERCRSPGTTALNLLTYIGTYPSYADTLLSTWFKTNGVSSWTEDLFARAFHQNEARTRQFATSIAELQIYLQRRSDLELSQCTLPSQVTTLRTSAGSYTHLLAEVMRGVDRMQQPKSGPARMVFTTDQLRRNTRVLAESQKILGWDHVDFESALRSRAEWNTKFPTAIRDTLVKIYTLVVGRAPDETASATESQRDAIRRHFHALVAFAIAEGNRLQRDHWDARDWGRAKKDVLPALVCHPPAPRLVEFVFIDSMHPCHVLTVLSGPAARRLLFGRDISFFRFFPFCRRTRLCFRPFDWRIHFFFRLFRRD